MEGPKLGQVWESRDYRDWQMVKGVATPRRVLVTYEGYDSVHVQNVRTGRASTIRNSEMKRRWRRADAQ